MTYSAYLPDIPEELRARMQDKILARFLDKTAPQGNCLIWTGWTNGKGYGGFFNGLKQVYAHRWNYERVKGPVPQGLILDHLCRNTSCVLPEHLEAVTQQENILRGLHPQKMSERRRPDQTKCGTGKHDWIPENIYTNPQGSQRCYRCKLESNRRYKARKKGNSSEC